MKEKKRGEIFRRCEKKRSDGGIANYEATEEYRGSNHYVDLKKGLLVVGRIKCTSRRGKIWQI